jgi:hypothetical protein
MIRNDDKQPTAPQQPKPQPPVGVKFSDWASI